MIKFSDILFCAADSNYVKIFLVTGQNHLISITHKWVEEQLPYSMFFQIHKSRLVNLNHIVSYSKNKETFLLNGNYNVLVTSMQRKHFIQIRLMYTVIPTLLLKQSLNWKHKYSRRLIS